MWKSLHKRVSCRSDSSSPAHRSLPCSQLPSSPVSSHPETGKGCYQAGSKGNLKFSWLHHFSKHLLRTTQIATLQIASFLWRHSASPITVLTCIGTQFEIPHDIKVQFPTGGTINAKPVASKPTYGAFLFQPPLSLLRAIPLSLTFSWEAGVLLVREPHLPPRAGGGEWRMMADTAQAEVTKTPFPSSVCITFPGESFFLAIETILFS